MAVTILGGSCEDVISLASNRLKGICENFSNEKIAEILLKRRQKWRKRRIPEHRVKGIKYPFQLFGVLSHSPTESTLYLPLGRERVWEYTCVLNLF